MDFLVDDNSNRVYECGTIERGVFNDVDPDTELFKITNDRGVFYAVTNGFSVKSADNVPDDYQNYTYTDEDGFVKLDIPLTQEQKVDNLTDVYNSINDSIANINDALIELYENMM